MHNNFHYMNLALDQARLALGETLPNPAVGAVIVQSDNIAGSGHTQKAGFDHAEVQAIKDAGEQCQGATIYVTLEPCCHFGKTPPCTNAIISSGIKKVVIGYNDPNPLVNGKGAEALRRAGIEVEYETLGDEIKEFYLPFATYVVKKRPFVYLKIAQSIDGYISGPNKERVQISGPECRAWMHDLRSKVDGVLIGGSTMIHDNPNLTVRLGTKSEKSSNPQRFVMTQRSELPNDLNIWNTSVAPTILYTNHFHANLPEAVEQVIVEKDFLETWEFILDDMYNRGLHQIMVECGANLVSKLIKTGLWDRFIILTGSVILGKGYSWSEKLSLEWSKSINLSKFATLGRDYLTIFENCESNVD